MGGLTEILACPNKQFGWNYETQLFCLLVLVKSKPIRGQHSAPKQEV